MAALSTPSSSSSYSSTSAASVAVASAAAASSKLVLKIFNPTILYSADLSRSSTFAGRKSSYPPAFLSSSSSSFTTSTTVAALSRLNKLSAVTADSSLGASDFSRRGPAAAAVAAPSRLVPKKHAAPNQTRKVTNDLLSLYKKIAKAHQRFVIRNYIAQNLSPRYRITKKVGEGVQSQVFKAIDTTKTQEVVLKFSTLRDYSDQRNEEKILSLLASSSFFPKVLDGFDLNGIRVTVLPYLNENLLSLLSTSKESQKITWIDGINISFQLLLALNDISKLNIVHGDIKPENLYFDLTTGKLTLADMGLSKLLSHMEEVSLGLIQTRWYRAPEVCLGLPWGKSSDIWSAGCLIFEFVTRGEPLFPSRLESQHILKICEHLGPPPNEWLEESPVREECFHKIGDDFIPKSDCVVNNLERKIIHAIDQSYPSIETKDIVSLAKLINDMISYKTRPTPAMALEYQIFQKHVYCEIIFKEPLKGRVFRMFPLDRSYKTRNQNIGAEIVLPWSEKRPEHHHKMLTCSIDHLYAVQLYENQNCILNLVYKVFRHAILEFAPSRFFPSSRYGSIEISDTSSTSTASRSSSSSAAGAASSSSSSSAASAITRGA